MTPARPASAVPAANTSVKMRGTLWPSADAMSGWVSAAWIAKHHHDEDDRAHRKGHRGLGDLIIAADDTGEAGQRGAGGEYQCKDARHVVAERRRHVGMGQRGL